MVNYSHTNMNNGASTSSPMAASNGGGRLGGTPRISDMSLASFIVPKASKKGDTERDSASPHINNTNNTGNNNNSSTAGHTHQILQRARMASEQPRRNSAADYGGTSRRGGAKAANRGVSVSEQQRRANTLNNLRHVRHNNNGAAHQQRTSEVNNHYVQRRETKENYCYFDASTRGFIYDFEGTRGWRKSHPTNKREFDQRLLEQKTKNARENNERYQSSSVASLHQQPSTSSAQQQNSVPAAVSAKQQPMGAGGHSHVFPSHQSASIVNDQKSNVRMPVPQLHNAKSHHQHIATAAQKRPSGIPPSLHLPPPLAASASATAAAEAAAAFVKYDAATDGFYYENASADVWRRRQPLNHAINSSNGVAAPQQHQMSQQRASQTNLTPAAVSQASAIAAAHQFWRMQAQQQNQQHNNSNSASSFGPLFQRGAPSFKNNSSFPHHQRASQHDNELDEFVKHFLEMQMQNNAGGIGVASRHDAPLYAGTNARVNDYFSEPASGMFAPPRERQMSYAEVEDMILSRSAPQTNGGGVALPLNNGNLANCGVAHYLDNFAHNNRGANVPPHSTIPFSQHVCHKRGASSDLSAYNSASTTTVNSSVSDSPPPLFLQRVQQQQHRNLLLQQQQEAQQKQRQQQNEHSYASALLRGCAQAWKAPAAANGGAAAAFSDTTTILGNGVADVSAHRRQQSSETSAEDAYEFWGDADSTSLDGGGGRQSANENNGWSNFSSCDYLRTLNIGGIGAIGDELARKTSRETLAPNGDSTRGVLKPIQRPGVLNPSQKSYTTPKKDNFNAEQFIEDFVAGRHDYGVPSGGLFHDDYVKNMLTPTATPTAGVPSSVVGGASLTCPSELSRCLWPKTADSTATTPSAFAPPFGGGGGYFPSEWPSAFFKPVTNNGAVTPLASNGGDENGALDSHLRDIWKCPAF